MRWKYLVVACCLLPLAIETVAAESSGTAPKPLYRDPVYDGAADPVVIWNPLAQKWWMFYTNRRANVPDLRGVSWVHGTPIGIAESADGGVTWSYVGTAEIDSPDTTIDEPTFWAPDVVRGDDGQWHMFVSVVPGVFDNWDHPRTIYHYTSRDLRKWTNPRPLELASDRVIDASLFKLPDGTWRMWYNNERDHKSIYVADSPNLNEWTELGRARGVGDRCEGPKVFRWNDKYWMVVDQWRGLGVFRSDDAEQWEAQPDNLLQTPGQGEDDQVQGQHADVLVNDDQAYLFYFTHPGRRGPDADRDSTEQRRSSIQVVELETKDGWLTCDRDRPTQIDLVTPVK
jgi:Glycosyl hydrolases family 43